MDIRGQAAVFKVMILAAATILYGALIPTVSGFISTAIPSLTENYPTTAFLIQLLPLAILIGIILVAFRDEAPVYG